MNNKHNYRDGIPAATFFIGRSVHNERQPIEVIRKPDVEPLDPVWSVAQHCRRAA